MSADAEQDELSVVVSTHRQFEFHIQTAVLDAIAV